jgi:mannose-6-phosphate isomerase-like protein (cupin superfamily)
MSFCLEKITLENEYYRREVHTTKYQQLVIMSICDYIPEEIHKCNDQFLKIVKGKCSAKVNGEEIELEDGDSINISAGSKHEIINNGDEPLKLYTIYSPPHHPVGICQKKRVL